MSFHRLPFSALHHQGTKQESGTCLIVCRDATVFFFKAFVSLHENPWIPSQALGVLLFFIAYGRLPFDGEAKLQILNGDFRIPPKPVRSFPSTPCSVSASLLAGNRRVSSCRCSFPARFSPPQCLLRVTHTVCCLFNTPSLKNRVRFSVDN